MGSPDFFSLDYSQVMVDNNLIHFLDIMNYVRMLGFNNINNGENNDMINFLAENCAYRFALQHHIQLGDDFGNNYFQQKIEKMIQNERWIVPRIQEIPTKKDRFIFLHARKCGGSSLRTVFVDSARKNGIGMVHKKRRKEKERRKEEGRKEKNGNIERRWCY